MGRFTTLGWWLNGLLGAFIGAASGVTTVTTADAIGSSYYGIPPGFSPYQPGGLKKLGMVALGMGATGAFQWLKQHPTPFVTTSVSTTLQEGQSPKTTVTVTESKKDN